MRCRRTPMAGVVPGVIAPPPSFRFGAQYWQGRYRVPRMPETLRVGTAMPSWSMNFLPARGLLYHNTDNNSWTVRSG